MRRQKFYQRLVKWFNDRLVPDLARSFAWVAGGALIGSVGLITVYIVLRKLALYKVYFVEEWSAYLLVLITYFSLGYTLIKRKHISIDVVVSRLHELPRRVLRVVGGLSGLGVMIYCLKLSISFFIYNLESGVVSLSMIHTPMWIPTLFVPVGLVIFILAILRYSLQNLIELVDYLARKG